MRKLFDLSAPVEDISYDEKSPIALNVSSIIPTIALGYVPFVFFLMYLTSMGPDRFAGYYLFIYSGMCLMILLPIYSIYLIKFIIKQYKKGMLTLKNSIFYALSFIVPFWYLLMFATFSGSPA